MGTTRKINVSGRHDVVEAARTASGGNLSAFVDAALREKLLRHALGMLSAEGHRGLPDDVVAAVGDDRTAA